jgi:c-di-GMP-binding flagellar brake protein YcgR
MRLLATTRWIAMNQPAKVQKEKRRSPRFRVRIGAKVIVKSIGSHDTYECVTGNVSAGGILVVGEQTEEFPFGDKSILEVWLTLKDLDGTVDTQATVYFMGKVAHKASDSGFGVKIVQIEDDDQDKLDEFITKFAEAHHDKLMK